jgi:hypothetical protein
VRFVLAVVIAAAAQTYIYLHLADWIGAGAMLAVLYIAFTAIGAGWFAARRSALAGALSVALAVGIYACVTFFGPAGIGMLPLDLALGIMGLVLAYWPYIAIGALAGAVGGSLRRRFVGAAR